MPELYEIQTLCKFSFIPDFRVFEHTCTDSGFQKHCNDLKSLCNVFVFDVLQIVQFQKRVVMLRLLQGQITHDVIIKMFCLVCYTHDHLLQFTLNFESHYRVKNSQLLYACRFCFFDQVTLLIIDRYIFSAYMYISLSFNI